MLRYFPFLAYNIVMAHLNQFIHRCNNNLNLRTSEVDRANIYLRNRGINSNSIKEHKIGYCPRDEEIPNEIKFYGKEIKENDEGYSYFIQGRLIVPIYGEFGKAVGFATRKPSTESDNSWWNCPFKKGNHLFLLDKSRKDIFNNNKIYLVEGYMDALILHQAGLRGTVCLMGTKMSPRKVGLIARYCDNVCICLDVDENKAGQNAQKKIIHDLRKFDFCESISVIEGLPIGMDPDEYVIKNGLKDLLAMEKKMSDAEIMKIYKEVEADERA